MTASSLSDDSPTRVPTVADEPPSARPANPIPPGPQDGPIEPAGPGRKLLAVACVLVVLIATGLVVLLLRRGYPPMAAVRAQIVQPFGSMPIRIAESHVDFSVRSPRECTVRFDAILETTEPLFQRTEAAPALASRYAADLPKIETAGALLRGAAGPRVRAAVSEPEPTPALGALVVVERRTPAGTQVTYSGQLRALRIGRTWTFSVVDARLERARLAGEPKPAGSVCFDLPPDVERVRLLVAAHVAYAAKVRDAAQVLAVEIQRERQARANRLAELLATGTVWAGTATDVGRSLTHRVTLEVTDYSLASGRIATVLRNDGGWGEGRPFQGEATMDADAERCAIALRTRSTQRLADSGPLLDQPGDWSISLEVSANRTVAASSTHWAMQMERLEPVAAAKMKAELAQFVAETQEAAKPGTVYHGTVVSRQSARSEPVILRFTDQDAGGVGAVLESTGHDRWSRRFRGGVIGNTYRSGNLPLQLRSGDRERVVQADERSVFGQGAGESGLLLALRVVEAGLDGEAGPFTYHFERADAAWLQRREAERRERSDGFFGLIKAGAAYEGIARETGGAATRLHLRIDDVQPTDGLVVLTWESRDQPGAFHRMSGTFDVSAGTLEVGSTGAMKAAPNGVVTAPLFTHAATRRVTLAVTPDLITGEVVREGWTLSFPTSTRTLGTAATLPASGPTPLASLPALPTASGAYILVNGAWLKLPRSQARTLDAAKVVSTLSSLFRGVQEVAAGRLPDVKSEQLATLVFPANEPAPAVPPGEVLVVYIGRLEAPSAETVERYPQLRDYPLIELGIAQWVHDDKRQAALRWVAPGVLGAVSRLSARLEQPEPGVTLVRSTGPVPVGHYVITCRNEAYEIVIGP